MYIVMYRARMLRCADNLTKLIREMYNSQKTTTSNYSTVRVANSLCSTHRGAVGIFGTAPTSAQNMYRDIYTLQNEASSWEFRRKHEPVCRSARASHIKGRKLEQRFLADYVALLKQASALCSLQNSSNVVCA